MYQPNFIKILIYKELILLFILKTRDMHGLREIFFFCIIKKNDSKWTNLNKKEYSWNLIRKSNQNEEGDQVKIIVKVSMLNIQVD